MESSISLNFKNNNILPSLYGEKNANITFIEKLLGISISSRGNYLSITGNEDSINVAAQLLESMYSKVEKGTTRFSPEDIKALVDKINSNTNDLSSSNVQLTQTVIKTKRKNIFPYNDSQARYIKTFQEKDIVFGIGVAGTGKTYLAVAEAVNLFIEKKVARIILTRPAVEAGEKLGFLPGDLKEKIDPYLQPLYDALYEMLPSENIERYIATKEIQIAPLAFMRGRTLNNAFVILDEAQNATITQMKMFLTRLGMGSKMAITGDLSQIDLPPSTPSGLIDSIEKLKHLNEIGIVKFESKDVVRHQLVAKIVDAYERPA